MEDVKVTDIIRKYPQYRNIPYAADFTCRCCGKSRIRGKDRYGRPMSMPELVGYAETDNGFMAIFKCPLCHERFRFHPHIMPFDFDEFNVCLEIYLGDSSGRNAWISNAGELSAKLGRNGH